MKLKQFIDNLENIKRKHGGDAEVAMADFMPVVSPVYLDDSRIGKVVVITDQSNTAE